MKNVRFMENKELRKLQKLYIQESNAFLEGIRQGVSWEFLNKKKEKIRELSRLLDQERNDSRDPSSNRQRMHD